VIWTHSKIAVLDFEGEVSSGVVEFGVVIIKDLNIISTETKLCSSLGELHPKTSKIHGLKQNDLFKLKPFRKNQKLFTQLRDSVDVFCAHHASVEENLLKDTWPYRPIRNKEHNIDWGPWVDTLQLYKRLYPGVGNYSLAHLVSTFGIGEVLEKNATKYCPPRRQKYHCALYDTLASALLLTRLAEEAKISEASLEWLIETSTSNQKMQGLPGQLTLFDP
jgi:DNA polymerase III epsilon subunit-like protein